MDVNNLDVFNYFHYLDTYGVLRVIDRFSTYEDLNEYMEKHGPGWTIYYSGHQFTEEELIARLKTYYEYKGRMVPLSQVDLSQFDDLKDVYIVQGSRRLQFKLDEDFRYELHHPGYFYPSLNAKFPVTPAQYAARSTTFRENGITDILTDVFGQGNLFMLDMEDPQAVMSSIGRIDIPVRHFDSECILAYEDYTDESDQGIRNCNLYDVSDPRSLRFIQFIADAQNEEDGVPESDSLEELPFTVPDQEIANMSFTAAVDRIA